MFTLIRTSSLRCAAVAGAFSLCIGAASAQAAALARDPSLIGRPSPDAPDACAALPLEWRLRCHGGPIHTVSEIGAPYGASDMQPDDIQRNARQPQRHTQQHTLGDSPCDDDRDLPGHARLGEPR